MEESEVRKVFQRVLQAAGLPSFRLDDLRHTFASLLLSSRAPLLDVSQQLGHDEPTPTRRYYAHWIPREGQSFVSLLEGDPAETWHQELAPSVHDAEEHQEGVEKNGAGEWGRTTDLLITNQLLYH